MTNNPSAAMPTLHSRSMSCGGSVPRVSISRHAGRLCDNSIATTSDTSARATRTAAATSLPKALQRGRKKQIRKLPAVVRVRRTPCGDPRNGGCEMAGPSILLDPKTFTAPQTRRQPCVRVADAARNLNRT
jgi:hypothetical protein